MSRANYLLIMSPNLILNINQILRLLLESTDFRLNLSIILDALTRGLNSANIGNMMENITSINLDTIFFPLLVLCVYVFWNYKIGIAINIEDYKKSCKENKKSCKENKSTIP